MAKFPKTLRQLTPNLRPLSHPALGWVIVSGRDNTLIHFLTDAISFVFKKDLRVSPTLEEALAYLQLADTTLHDWGITSKPE